MKQILLFLTLILLVGCSSYTEQEKNSYDSQIQSFLKRKNLKMTKLESGVYEQETKQGDGKEIKLGDILVVRYTGKLLNGSVFDKTEKPIDLPLNSLIAGWKEVLVGKKIGTEVHFICPPHMGYGRSKREKIPENSILFFEVKVIDVK